MWQNKSRHSVDILEVRCKYWDENRAEQRQHILLARADERLIWWYSLPLCDEHFSCHYFYCGKYSDPNRTSRGNITSSAFQSVDSESGSQWSLRRLRWNCFCCLLDLHSTGSVANLSHSLLCSPHWRHHFLINVLVDNHRHKRWQTFSVVAGTKVQTSCNTKTSICGCYILLGLSRSRQRYTWDS